MSFKRISKKQTFLTSMLGLTLIWAGCGMQLEDGSDQVDDQVSSSKHAIVDVAHTAVERQSIGNCWLYAQASWVESLHLSNLQAGGGGTTPTEQVPIDKVSEYVARDATVSYTVKIPANAKKVEAVLAPNSGDPDIYITYGDNPRCRPYLGGTKVETCSFSGPPAGEMLVEIKGYKQSTFDLKVTVEVTGGATPKQLDVSQSYWTYWHWFDQVTGYMYDDEISTGGNQWKSNSIVRERGYMLEENFVPEDAKSEMSNRQSSAKRIINAALKDGELKTSAARKDGKLVRKVFDKAWGLSADVTAQLDKVFGEDGEMTLRSGGEVDGTKIIDPTTVAVRYAERKSSGETVYRKGMLVDAIKSWTTARYPSSGKSSQRAFLKRVQRALHDRQPVGITWDVDFNALDNDDAERAGSFNLQTLKDAGKPGSQGGHMTVLEDYAAVTVEFGLIEAAKTLDPNVPGDAAKLKALLLDSTKITLLRTKNSWGANRPDRKFAKGFPGYHDLWMDYLNGPIKFCPSVDNKTDENCKGETTPLRSVMLPPGY